MVSWPRYIRCNKVNCRRTGPYWFGGGSGSPFSAEHRKWYYRFVVYRLLHYNSILGTTVEPSWRNRVWVIDPEGAEAVPIDYFDLLVYVFVLLALFGFAYSKQFLTRKIWQYFFPFIIIWDIWLTYIDFEFRDFINLGITPIIIFSVVLVVIIIPQYVALYRYAYREYGLWLAKWFYDKPDKFWI